MNESRTILLAEVPIGGKGGFLWNRLHEEREDICEALLKRSDATQYRQDLLQGRRRTIDDALDRLMSGSYGSCSNCGRSIEDATLEIDAAWAFCMDCSVHESDENKLSADESDSEIIPERLNSFDTILLHTHGVMKVAVRP